VLAVFARRCHGACCQFRRHRLDGRRSRAPLPNRRPYCSPTRCSSLLTHRRTLKILQEEEAAVEPVLCRDAKPRRARPCGAGRSRLSHRTPLLRPKKRRAVQISCPVWADCLHVDNRTSFIAPRPANGLRLVHVTRTWPQAPQVRERSPAILAPVACPHASAAAQRSYDQPWCPCCMHSARPLLVSTYQCRTSLSSVGASA